MVTQLGYIEHEWHPLDGLRAAWRVLKPGGVLVIKTPNYASWNRRVMGMEWCGYHVPAHCNYFTPRTLARILRRTGFDPLPQPSARPAADERLALDGRPQAGSSPFDTEGHCAEITGTMRPWPRCYTFIA